jgi:hypothetical protein
MPSTKLSLNVVTKQHGFKNFAEYQAVAVNIYLVMASIDPQTKVFTDLPTALKNELEHVTAAKDCCRPALHGSGQ